MLRVPNLRTLRIELSEPDDDTFSRAEDLGCAFIDIPTSIHSSKLEMLIYDFRKIGEELFGEMDMDEDMDWELVCSTLRHMRPAEPSRTPLQIKMLFDASHKDEEDVNTLRSALQDLEDSGLVHFQFDGAGA